MNILALLSIEVKRVQYYRSLICLNLLFMGVSTFLQLNIFRFFLSGESDILLQSSVVYVILATGIFVLLATSKVPEFAENIRSGNFIKYTIRPLGIFHQVLLQELGNSLSSLIIAAPFLLLGTSLHCFYFETSLVYLGRFIIVGGVGVLLSILLTNSVFSLTFLTVNYGGVRAVLQGVTALLSGSMVPLILWPDQLVRLFAWLPFAMVIDAPIRVYLGSADFISVLVTQILWCLFFYLVGNLLFYKLREYCDVVGG